MPELLAETGIGSGDGPGDNGRWNSRVVDDRGGKRRAATSGITNSGELFVGMVNATAGVTIADALDNNDGDAITLIASSPLIVGDVVVNNDGGDITLTATDDGGDDDHLTIGADVTAAGGNGSIDLNAGTDLEIDGATVSTVGNGAITASAVRAAILHETTTIQSDAGDITLEANQGMTPVTGNFEGVSLEETTIQTTSGAILITGLGGTTAGKRRHPARLFHNDRIPGQRHDHTRRYRPRDRQTATAFTSSAVLLPLR